MHAFLSATIVGSSAALQAPVVRTRPIVMGTASDEMGLPCVADCALPKYPNMPPSVHPGVVTGQALVDLLNDAKEKGCVTTALRLDSYHIRANCCLPCTRFSTCQ